MKNDIRNLLTSVKNGLSSKKSNISIHYTNTCKTLLEIMWDNGYIAGFQVRNRQRVLKVFLKYNAIGCPAIRRLQIVSKSSQIYNLSYSQLWKLKLNQSTLIFSTEKGILSEQQCKKQKVGGEVLICVS